MVAETTIVDFNTSRFTRVMSDNENRIDQDRELILAAQKKGFGATFATYTKLSGPGWLQSAITLGGGSLASSLYLGVLAGYGMLWLQPFAMILGIIMLSCIAYVTLSTGERPFQAIRDHINPVLAWAWALATLMANMVWSLPQFALANGVLQQNLAPNLLGGDVGKMINCFVILLVSVGITWCYGNGGRGIKIYEMILKIMVAMIVLSFVGVVLKMGSGENGLNWGEVFAGFVPDLSKLSAPAEGFVPLLEAVPEAARTYWSDIIVNTQRDVMISAAATAVGINMTFLLGYSLLAKGWDRSFRGLTIFDLSTGMFIPFVLATSCVVIAASTQFHLKPSAGLLGETDANGELIQPNPKAAGALAKSLTARVTATLSDEEKALSADELQPVIDQKIAALPLAEKRIAATLIKRDVGELALALEPLTGKGFANIIFGLGVLGMALSTISILMLISGFVICEMLDLPHTGLPFKLGCLAACTGVLGPFFWGDAAAYLAVPTSVFGMALLPIAYISFFLLMNQKSLLKEHLPAGPARIVWNVLLFIAAGVATAASLFVINQKVGAKGWIGVGILLALALIAHFTRKKPVAS